MLFSMYRLKKRQNKDFTRVFHIPLTLVLERASFMSALVSIRDPHAPERWHMKGAVLYRVSCCKWEDGGSFKDSLGSDQTSFGSNKSTYTGSSMAAFTKFDGYSKRIIQKGTKDASNVSSN